ncbi:transposase [Bizionia argentinensis JUB59]|uniref:Transposase n=1 Tax=Bizionia argentinensis JUB59 TaxID=1046627 RepID=G2EDS3_9FLAO|nr:transposase [Bizionia argentinensis]EGV43332.2 transposase [Bizionia argentinensis JUB59]
MKYEPLIEDNYYHIYNCGNNKEDIFLEDDNYLYFLSLTKKYLLDVVDILAYCLMKNHFHFLVKTKENQEQKKISQAFSNFFNAYAKAFNKKHQRTGGLFKDRFSRIKISVEAYLKSLVVYIHLNPVHHGFTDNFKTYKYSSFQSLLSKQPTKLDRSFVLELFDNEDNLNYVHEQKKIHISETYFLE